MGDDQLCGAADWAERCGTGIHGGDPAVGFAAEIYGDWRRDQWEDGSHDM